ncbi:hypothetical protein ABZX40_26845 [Streptomyces sp. NPDC004610]|uniref:hypothetical protein n=1 Tax=unclassified Streptomyces TaxID=2593676 RepID=UPI0033B329A3
MELVDAAVDIEQIGSEVPCPFAYLDVVAPVEPGGDLDTVRDGLGDILADLPERLRGSVDGTFENRFEDLCERVTAFGATERGPYPPERGSAVVPVITTVRGDPSGTVLELGVVDPGPPLAAAGDITAARSRSASVPTAAEPGTPSHAPCELREEHSNLT